MELNKKLIIKQKLKPFIKWVGGKTQLLKEINKILPPIFNKYFEPFLGGGALFLNLEHKNSILNDSNKSLINTWKTIKENKDELIYILENEFLNIENTCNFFKEKKFEFNNLNPKSKKERIRKAALFIFINKSCYNGLYRVNSNNEFNVPWNKNPKVFIDIKMINKINDFLNKNNVNFYSQDFEKILNKAEKGDLAYIDPPYDNLKKHTFKSYSVKIFTLKDQERLSKICKKLTNKGVFLIISNHHTENIKKFYKDFKMNLVEVRRSINSVGSKRKGHFEVIITNFDYKTYEINKKIFK